MTEDDCPGATPLVAVLNANVDHVLILEALAHEEGYRTCATVLGAHHTAAEALYFLQSYEPDICVYDVTFPYAERWTVLQQVRHRYPTCRWVVTTTDVRAVRALGEPTDAVELVAKPFDLDEVAAALRRAAAGWAARGDRPA
jgi:DNA-binding NarL/FixJ family response regulator